MKVFLDDERSVPPGWVGAKWPQQVISFLETGKVTEISLDHDLGDDERGTGYDVLTWIEEMVMTRGFCPPAMKVHSSNPSARLKMDAAIRSITACCERTKAQIQVAEPKVLEPQAIPTRSRTMQVLELHNQGLSISQISEKLGVNKYQLYSIRAQLRCRGLIPFARRVLGQKVCDSKHLIQDNSPSQAPLVFQEIAGGASIDDLRTEVLRQCREDRFSESATRSGLHTFITTLNGHKIHVHRARVDLLGDGATGFDESGHVHQVSRFRLSVNLEHCHALMLP